MCVCVRVHVNVRMFECVRHVRSIPKPEANLPAHRRKAYCGGEGGVKEIVASQQNSAGLDIYSSKIHHTRAVLRLVWPFDGIVQKHIHNRLICTLKCSFNYPEPKIINSHCQF